METFVKGEPKYNTEHFKAFAEIHEMAEKPGYIGKTYSFAELTPLRWEQKKSEIIKSTELIDQYLSVYVPNYYFTFNEEAREVVYFMEEIHEDRILPPVEGVDKFLATCCETYIATSKKGEAFMVDINKIENLVYGHTDKVAQPKLYFIDFYPFFLNSLRATKLTAQLSEFAKVYGSNSLPKTKAVMEELNKTLYANSHN